jgi:hypothetical protein
MEMPNVSWSVPAGTTGVVAVANVQTGAAGSVVRSVQ